MKLEVGQRIDVFKVTDNSGFQWAGIENGKYLCAFGYDNDTAIESGVVVKTKFDTEITLWPDDGECRKVGTMIITKFK